MFGARSVRLRYAWYAYGPHILAVACRGLVDVGWSLCRLSETVGSKHNNGTPEAMGARWAGKAGELGACKKQKDLAISERALRVTSRVM